jgi:hypothetical protein
VPLLGYDRFVPSTLLFIFHHSPQPSTIHSLFYCEGESFVFTVAFCITPTTSFFRKQLSRPATRYDLDDGRFEVLIDTWDISYSKMFGLLSKCTSSYALNVQWPWREAQDSHSPNVQAKNTWNSTCLPHKQNRRPSLRKPQHTITIIIIISCIVAYNSRRFI